MEYFDFPKYKRKQQRGQFVVGLRKWLHTLSRQEHHPELQNWLYMNCSLHLTNTYKQHWASLHTVNHWFLLLVLLKDFVIRHACYKHSKHKETLARHHFPQTSRDRFDLPQHAMRWEGEDETTMNMTRMSKTSPVTSVGVNCRWGAEVRRGTSFFLSLPHTSSVVTTTRFCINSVRRKKNKTQVIKKIHPNIHKIHNLM